ncbi:hypothetical protein NA57DRAFT_61238 [Rhizodiscina lignyota]|uniref:Uncharacterized protein n=1 Tax=Rhizodiscina lignyota TaxID=1504668 RepID=A0A9P4I5H3_9PEZI|nr:hypothetical protein NA57DRAFT_61238 [Rhizodiscina lignyota]
MSSSVGNAATLSGSKIEPLDSNQKYNTEHDLSDRGSAGTNTNIDEARIDPLGGRVSCNAGQYQHPEAHADSQGVVGREDVIQGAKIDPLEQAPGMKSAPVKGGLDDENVDASRINPMGEVREQMQ